MASRPRANSVTEETIRRHVGERSFRLGQEYAKSGSVFRCQRNDESIRACCRGQSADHYVLSARLKGGRIVETACNCPVGEGGRCKHVAALLITFLTLPETFLETASLEKRLAACERPKLIELIMQMIDREPDLESWLELAMPAALPSGATVEPEPYSQRTVQAFSEAGYGWEADRHVTAELSAIRKIAEQFVKQENFESASAVLSGMLDGFLSVYETFRDETGNVGNVAQQCIASLGKCLGELAEGSENRQTAVETLFNVIRFDIDLGGIGLSDEIPAVLLERTTPAERATIATWIRSEAAADKQFSSEWHRQWWGSLLFDFEGEPADDEAYLRHCREFGLAGALVERLLDRGRLDEAIREIQAASHYQLVGHADQLIAHKHTDLAYALVSERLASEANRHSIGRLRDWLKKLYRSQKQWSELVELELEDFRARPSLMLYQEIRKLAKKLKTWKKLRPELMVAIPQDSSELIRIHLDEGENEQAIELLDARVKKQKGVGCDAIDLEVAKAVEQTHPDVALTIYRNHAERLIAGRGRVNYQLACEQLQKIKRLSGALGRQDDWSSYLKTLREELRTLSAFQDELSRAKL